jgi:transposase
MLYHRRLTDAYRFPGLRPLSSLRGIFGDPRSRVVKLSRRKNQTVRPAAKIIDHSATTSDQRRVRDLSCGDCRIYLDFEIRHVRCQDCGKVKQEELSWLVDNPIYTKRFAFFVERRCRSAIIRAVARKLYLDWKTVKELENRYMRERLRRTGALGLKVIGIDEVSIRKGHSYRIVVSDLIRRRPIWFGGKDRSEESLDQFYQSLGPKKRKRIRLAVMDIGRHLTSIPKLSHKTEPNQASGKNRGRYNYLWPQL